MSNLIHKDRPAVLTSFNLKEAIAKRKAEQGQALLLDCSGSMEILEFDGETHKPRVEFLNDILTSFSSTRRFRFGSDCKEDTSRGPVKADMGGTRLGKALMHLKEQGVHHVILITDGQPDSEEAAIAAAKGLKIDAYFVGGKNDTVAKDFLRRLCNSSGGTFGATSITEVKEITAGIKALLGDGR